MISRLIPLQLDLPLLATYDINEPKQQTDISDPEEILRLAAQEDLQELVNALFALPRNSSDACQLPKLTTMVMKMPRSQPLPSMKQATRWEQFAKVKGIRKRKRSAMVYNEELGRYVARHGSRSAKNLKHQQDDWCVEVD